MENNKEENYENYLEPEVEYPMAVSPFCKEYLPPSPPAAVTVMHQTIGGKGVVGRIGK